MKQRNRRKKVSQEPVTTIIQSLSHDGRGIAKIQDKTTFIRNALPGEKVIFRYTSCRGQFDEGDAFEILEHSPQRAIDICPHYQMCGGCSLQHLKHEAQIAHKQQVVLEQLKHFGQVTPEEIVEPIVGKPFGYRRKARLGVRFVQKKNSVLVGFREANGRYLADIHECRVLHEALSYKIDALRDLIASLEAFQEIAQIEVAIEDQAALIFRHLKPLSHDDLKKLAAFGHEHQFSIYLQSKGIDSIRKFFPDDGQDLLKYTLPAYDVELLFHPTDFTQVNQEVNQQMVARALEWLDPQETDRVLDLFCGLGNFTIPLAKKAMHVVGIEGNNKMVARGQANAKHNHLNNVEFFAQDLTQDISSCSWAHQKYNKLLLDPSRAGALEFIQQIDQISPDKMVYVSCSPATFARDLGVLVHEKGYQLKKFGILDMFPHTSHVESIALLVKA